MRVTSFTWLASVVVLAGGCAFFPQDEGASEDGSSFEEEEGGRNVIVGSLPPGATLPSTPESGFTALEGLGECPAIHADEPQEEYQALTLRPCADGAPRCEEVVWDGAVEWDPTGSGSLLEWEPQIGFGTDGHAGHLLLMHRYPRDTSGFSYQGIPFEAVVYAFDSGTPLAAWRNQGVVGRSPRCELVPVLGQGRLWLLGFAEGTHEVGIATTPLGQPTPSSLRATVIDPTVLRGRKVASALVLGLESSDGRLYHIDSGLQITESFGPGMRLWLHSAVGDQLIVGTDQVSPPAFTYYRFDKDGFQMLLPGAGVLASDGKRLAWLERGAVPTERLLRLGTIDATRALVVDEAATMMVTVSEEPIALQLAGDRALVVVEPSFSDRRGMLIDLATKSVLGQVTLPAGTWGGLPFGIENDHVWYGADDIGGDGAFEQVRRAAYVPAM